MSAGDAPKAAAWLRAALAPLACALAGAALYLVASARTGLAAGELARLQAVQATGRLIEQWVGSGASALGRGPLDAALGGVRGAGSLPVLLGGYLTASIGAPLEALVGPIARERLGHLAVLALVPALVWALVRPAHGSRAAAASVAALLLVPRFAHEAACTSPGALAAAAWLLVLVPYTRSLGRGRVAWGIATGLAFGAALAISTSALALLALVPAHHAIVRWRAARRLARRGKLPLPSALVWMALAGPVVFFALDPWLWFDGADRARDLALAIFAPSFTPALYRGEWVSAPPAPGGFAPQLVALVVPTATLALAIAGALRLAHRALARVALPPRRRPARPPGSLGALVALGVLFSLALPAALPETLSTFPPHAMVAVPFLAMCAGIGLDGLVAHLERSLPPSAGRLRPRLAAFGAALALAPGAFALLSPPATWGAAFAPLAGGVGRVVRRGTVAAADATLALGLRGALESSGRVEASVYAPLIPADVWDGLHTLGGVRFHGRPAPSRAAADLLVLPSGRAGELEARAFGPAGPAPALATVTRDGVPLLSLHRGR